MLPPGSREVSIGAKIRPMNASRLAPLLAAVIFALYWIMRRPTVGERVGGALGLATGIAPAVWLVAVHGVPVKIVVGYAALFFIGSVLLKWSIYQKVMARYVLPSSSPAMGGTLQGILSAMCELGSAALAFGVVCPGLDVPSVLGFGAGAAAIEAVMLSFIENVHASGPNAELEATQVAVMRNGPVWVPAMIGFVDRGVATTLHIACRGLVAVGIDTARAWPVAIGLVLFAAVDGFAMSCLRSGWEFGRARVALRLYGVMVVPAWASVVALVIAI